ncbi:hypothetical protein [Novosphingobium huizhouense]|uniref:hypothetical protein n=1 Tax=Novosphingobium huizhouense TaxID=2866625 RepID=UPI001CD8D92A|nr:hypothetical protein [Novosphingobium huizhouense]
MKREAEEAVREQRAKWALAKSKQRRNNRIDCIARHQLPPCADLRALVSERERREASLLALWQTTNAPLSIRKVPATHIAMTATLTADAWMAAVILRAMGGKVSPAYVARFLRQYQRHQGKSADALKARMQSDLARVAVLHDEGVWRPIHSAADLDTPTSDWQDFDLEDDEHLGEADREGLLMSLWRAPPPVDRAPTPS